MNVRTADWALVVVLGLAILVISDLAMQYGGVGLFIGVSVLMLGAVGAAMVTGRAGERTPALRLVFYFSFAFLLVMLLERWNVTFWPRLLITAALGIALSLIVSYLTRALADPDSRR